MWNRQTDGFLAADSEYADAEIVLFGAAFDGTTSFRPGTRFGPKAIRAESYGLESYSLYQQRDLADCKLCDLVDEELPYGNAERALGMIEARAERIFADGKIPFLLGGEHLVSLGVVRAAVAKHPDLHVIHFDAHADLREDYLGERLSHATVMRRVWELVGDGRIHQFGIRSGERAEFDFARQHTDMHPLELLDLAEVARLIERTPVYLSIDLDVLDPSVFPGTGTPEPGGATFNELHQALLMLNRCHIVGCDVVELSPPYDPSGISTAAACKIVRELILMLARE